MTPGNNTFRGRDVRGRRSSWSRVHRLLSLCSVSRTVALSLPHYDPTIPQMLLHGSGHQFGTGGIPTCLWRSRR